MPTNKINKDKFYTVKEFSNIFEINPWSTRRLINIGAIKCSKIAGAWRILGSDVLEFIKINFTYQKPKRGAK